MRMFQLVIAFFCVLIIGLPLEAQESSLPANKNTTAPPSFKPVTNSSTKGSDAQVRGTNTFYGRTSIGFTNTDSTRCNPELPVCNPPIAENAFALVGDVLVGWGPIRSGSLYVTPFYQYTHNWASSKSQLDDFNNNWFKTRKARDFLFPTKSFLRNHHTSVDIRYLLGDFQLGWFARLSIGRLGSSILADKENLEETKTVTKSELFVPYVTYRFQKFYRGQIYFPLQVEVNSDEPRYSFSSYSFSGTGRGRFISVRNNNLFFISFIKTFINADLYYLNYKYSAITLDKNRTGISLGLDAPVYWDVRINPKFSYYTDTFPVKRARIPGYDKSPGADKNAPAVLETQKNTFTAYGVGLYWDFLEVNRLGFDISYEKTQSNILENNKTDLIWKIGYSYSIPKTVTVLKRTQRFQDNHYAEEF
jgi:hypothetical protein